MESSDLRTAIGPRAPSTDGNDRAAFSLLYSELRALAQAELRGERHGHTLSATALVNEAYVKLMNRGRVISIATEAIGDPASVDRRQFFALAAMAMRRILVDSARARLRQKRGGGMPVLQSGTIAQLAGDNPASLLDPIVVDEALTRLAVDHADAARVVEMRIFGGLPEATIAEVMDVSERTVRRHWTFAKAWLFRHFSEADA